MIRAGMTTMKKKTSSKKAAPTKTAGAVLIFAVIAFAIRAAVRGIGRDAAAHDDNMAAALRAESIKGDDR